MNSYAIARSAGVTRTVVSLVLNGRADRYGIAKNTQEKVRAAIRQAGYTPNLAIRNMFLGKPSEAVNAALRRMDPDTLLGMLGPILAERGYRIASLYEPVPDDSVVIPDGGLRTEDGGRRTDAEIADRGETTATENPATEETEPQMNTDKQDAGKNLGVEPPEVSEPVPDPTPEPAPDDFVVMPDEGRRTEDGGPIAEPEIPEPVPEPLTDDRPPPVIEQPAEPPAAEIPEPDPVPEPQPAPTPSPDPVQEPALPAEPAPEPMPEPEPVPEPITDAGIPPPVPSPETFPEPPSAPPAEPSPVPEPIPEPALQPPPEDSSAVVPDAGQETSRG